MCFPQFQRHFCFASPEVASPVSAPTARWCSTACFEVGQITQSKGFVQPASDVSSTGVWLLLKVLKFINQLNLRNFTAKEIFQPFMVKSHTSAQQQKEPLRNWNSLFRTGIVT